MHHSVALVFVGRSLTDHLPVDFRSTDRSSLIRTFQTSVPVARSSVAKRCQHALQEDGVTTTKRPVIGWRGWP